MKLDDLRWLRCDTGCTKSAFWFQGRSPAEVHKPTWELHRGKAIPCGPIELKVESGRKLTDLLGNGFLLLVMSQRLVELFGKEGLTGWCTYPVRLFDRHDVPIDANYFSFPVGPRQVMSRA